MCRWKFGVRRSCVETPVSAPDRFFHLTAIAFLAHTDTRPRTSRARRHACPSQGPIRPPAMSLDHILQTSRPVVAFKRKKVG